MSDLPVPDGERLDHPPGPRPHDPVRERRGVIAKRTKLAMRLGYMCLLAATIALIVALATDLSPVALSVATWSLFAGTVLLGPSIILSYMVRAAEREDL